MNGTDFINLVREAKALAESKHGSGAFPQQTGHHAKLIAIRNLQEQYNDLMPDEQEEAIANGTMTMKTMADLNRWVEDIFDGNDAGEIQTNTKHVNDMINKYFDL